MWTVFMVRVMASEINKADHPSATLQGNALGYIHVCNKTVERNAEARSNLKHGELMAIVTS